MERGWEMVGVVVTLVALVVAARGSDPELTTDFFVPDGVNKSTLTGDYFTSTLLRKGVTVEAPARVGLLRITSESAPVLTGLGVSAALIEYLPGGINPPHTHPRGTEVLYVLQGALTVGLVDTTTALFTQALQVGDVFVFPKGLVHYQINAGRDPVVAFLAFSSANPGTVSLPATLFGSGIPGYVLEAAFKVNQSVIDQLQLPFNVTS